MAYTASCKLRIAVQTKRGVRLLYLFQSVSGNLTGHSVGAIGLRSMKLHPTANHVEEKRHLLCARNRSARGPAHMLQNLTLSATGSVHITGPLVNLQLVLQSWLAQRVNKACVWGQHCKTISYVYVIAQRLGS